MKTQVKHLSGERVREVPTKDLALAALETVSDVSFTFWDEDLRLLYANKVHLTWHGVTLEEIVGRALPDLYPLVAERLSGLLNECFRTGEPHIGTTAREIVRQDGHKEYWMTDVYPMAIDGGRRIAFIRSRNITTSFVAGREAESERKKLHDLYSVLEEMPAACAVVKWPECTYELSNRMNTSWIGKGPVIGRHVREVLPELESQGIFSFLQKVAETGEPLAFQGLQVRVLQSDGTENEKYLNTAFEPIRNVHGVVDRVLVFATDVTEQIRANMELSRIASEARDHEQWIREVLNHKPTATLLIEPETGAILFANKAANEAAGGQFPNAKHVSEYETAYHCTYPDGGRIPPEEMPGMRAARGEALSGFEMDWHLPTDTRTVACHSCLLPAMHGHPAIVLVSFYDITDLKQAQKDAYEAVRVRDEYMSVASHELRTPLTSILLQAEMMRQWPDERVRTGAERIVKHGKRINEMVSTLLDVSRISHGEVPLDLEEVDLRGVVEETVNRLKLEAEKAGCSVQLDASRAVGEWDRGRVEQVVTNLLTNAFKYGKGGPVIVSVMTVGRWATLRVRDFGIGIQHEYQDRIFEQFQRVGPKGYAPGLGLGLWIVHKIISALGGRIRVESEPGEGSTFVVELPAKKE